MMPENELSTEPVQGSFLYPSNLSTTNLSWFENGGIAIQDTSQGLEYQAWKGYWDPDDQTVYLVPGIDGTPIPILSQSDVVEFSFCFDQNMRYILSLLLSDGTLNLHWFSPITGTYVVTSYTDVQSAALTLDDKRSQSSEAGSNDAILSYIKLGGDLVFRMQRDRYEVEYPLSTGVKPGYRITNFGMTKIWRLQWRLQFRSF